MQKNGSHANLDAILDYLVAVQYNPAAAIALADSGAATYRHIPETDTVFVARFFHQSRYYVELL
ncbi:MAG: hypothetical protein IK066_05740 [Kiritimatiellae bacterium]|nr:hypothetical protein [Kiritimatiellia bacterium]